MRVPYRVLVDQYKALCYPRPAAQSTEVRVMTVPQQTISNDHIVELVNNGLVGPDQIIVMINALKAKENGINGTQAQNIQQALASVLAKVKPAADKPEGKVDVKP